MSVEFRSYNILLLCFMTVNTVYLDVLLWDTLCHLCITGSQHNFLQLFKSLPSLKVRKQLRYTSQVTFVLRHYSRQGNYSAVRLNILVPDSVFCIQNEQCAHVSANIQLDTIKEIDSSVHGAM